MSLSMSTSPSLKLLDAQIITIEVFYNEGMLLQAWFGMYTLEKTKQILVYIPRFKG